MKNLEIFLKEQQSVKMVQYKVILYFFVVKILIVFF